MNNKILSILLPYYGVHFVNKPTGNLSGERCSSRQEQVSLSSTTNRLQQHIQQKGCSGRYITRRRPHYVIHMGARRSHLIFKFTRDYRAKWQSPGCFRLLRSSPSYPCRKECEKRAAIFHRSPSPSKKSYFDSDWLNPRDAFTKYASVLPL